MFPDMFLAFALTLVEITRSKFILSIDNDIEQSHSFSYTIALSLSSCPRIGIIGAVITCIAKAITITICLVWIIYSRAVVCTI
jgi:hypothetical protein